MRFGVLSVPVDGLLCARVVCFADRRRMRKPFFMPCRDLFRGDVASAALCGEVKAVRRLSFRLWRARRKAGVEGAAATWNGRKQRSSPGNEVFAFGMRFVSSARAQRIVLSLTCREMRFLLQRVEYHGKVLQRIVLCGVFVYDGKNTHGYMKE
ncbi:hypothetical protein [uncultured Mailhella sp.]|uniref:hypothetical protein n=1 Tax=uncultured Mailhella sp. TaxID=1981031 RepID=UPI0025D64461|nr:hypothetical protein [uncultured Mailhella sp.]